MNSYNELLKNVNWIKIRKSILKKDKLECISCKNKKIQDISEIGKIILIKRRTSMLELLNRSDPRFNKEYEVNYEDANGEMTTTTIYCFYEYYLEELEQFKDNSVFYNKAENLSFSKARKGEKIATCIEDTTGKHPWFYVNQLHIHHTYYDRSLRPWEYPIESLKTLCWICHNEQHTN